MADPLDLWILEDDIALCHLIAEQCERQNWNLQAFHEPRSLEAALAERSPQLLLLDQMLPEKCGTDVLASLRLQKPSVSGADALGDGGPKRSGAGAGIGSR